MKDSLDVVLCMLLRVGLGLSSDFPYSPSEEEWQSIFLMAQQQTVLGVVYNALSRLPAGSRPPRQLVLRYAAFVESKRGLNRLMNQEAARYTQMFEERGVRCVILKGQANARLYPDPLSRQAGDIDIWIPGGYEKVERLLLDMHFISEGASYHISRHIGFRSENGIEIEVHYRPAETPFRNREFQEFFDTEFDSSTLTPEGFYSPSIRFALIMQLQHLYYHCIREGVGFRHFMDYLVLLLHSTEDDRKFVWKKIRRFGLKNACAGTMWVLEKAFGLSQEKMLCPPNRKRGERLYRNTIVGGNFGRNVPPKRNRSVLRQRIDYRMHILSWFWFDPLYITLREIRYWGDTISLIPERIKRRKLYL